MTLATSGDPLADQTAIRIADQLGSPGFSPIPSPRPSVDLVSVSDADEEVREAVRQVTDAARRGLPLERIAILWTTAAPYQRLVGEHLTAAGIPWNGPSPIGLAEHLAGRTLLALLVLDRFGLRRRDLFGLLGTAPVRDRSGRLRAGSGVGAGQLERQRSGAATNGLAAWPSSPPGGGPTAGERIAAGEEGAAAGAERDAELAHDLSAVRRMAPPGARPDQRSPARGRSGWRGLTACCGCCSAATRFARRSPAVERAAFERVEAALDRLAGLDQLAPPADRATRSRNAVTAALDAELLRSGRIGDGVLAGSLISAIGLDTDLTIVARARRGDVPRCSTRRSVAPRQRSTTDGRRCSPSPTTRSPTNGANWWPRCAPAPRSWSASPAAIFATRACATRLVGSARSPTSTSPALAASTPSPPAWARPSSPPPQPNTGSGRCSPTPARAERSTSIRSVAADQVLHRNLTLLRAREQPLLTAYDGDLVRPERSLRRSTPGSTVSPTRLETWVGCPHRYFMRYVLRIPEPDDRDQQLRISPLDRGNLLHATLDRFLRAVIDGQLPSPLPTEPWSPAHGIAAVAILDEECAERRARRAHRPAPALGTRPAAAPAGVVRLVAPRRRRTSRAGPHPHRIRAGLRAPRRRVGRRPR